MFYLEACRPSLSLKNAHRWIMDPSNGLPNKLYIKYMDRVISYYALTTLWKYLYVFLLKPHELLTFCETSGTTTGAVSKPSQYWDEVFDV